MKIRSKAASARDELLTSEHREGGLSLLSEEELTTVLFEEAEKSTAGPINFPTIAGIGLIAFLILYLLSLINVIPWTLGGVMMVLPWASGALIGLLVFDLFAKRSAARRRRARQRAQKRGRLKGQSATTPPSATGALNLTKTAKAFSKKRLTKTADKKIFGVCGGLAEYLGLDPTLVRIAVSILALPTSGSVILIYLVMAWLMESPPKEVGADKSKPSKPFFGE